MALRLFLENKPNEICEIVEDLVEQGIEDTLRFVEAGTDIPPINPDSLASLRVAGISEDNILHLISLTLTEMITSNYERKRNSPQE